MARTQQIFVNKAEGPIYVSIEPWPECFELEPEDRLTLIWDAPEEGDSVEINFLNDREIIVSPNGPLDDLLILFNDGSSKGRIWSFNHRRGCGNVRNRGRRTSRVVMSWKHGRGRQVETV